MAFYNPEKRAPVDPEYLDAESGKDYFSVMKDRWATLSDREKEIAGLFVNGLGQNEIAQRLQLAPDTIRATKNHVYRKLGIDKSANLIKLWMYFEEKKYDPGMQEGDEDSRI